MIFWLGTHEASWLGTVAVPLFVSRRRLYRRKTFPRALAPWALDSGAFTELKDYGRWTISTVQYVREVRRFRDEIGGLAWAAPQDWMCEPFIVQKTGLSVEEHQYRTVANYMQMRADAPDVPWLPVLQGWRPRDYFAHLEQYARCGVDLRRLPLVGLGSVCRRQGTATAANIIRELYGAGLRLHGFGLKLTGLAQMARYLSSADSLAWSFDARRAAPLPGCSHASCANCSRWALRWRKKVLRAIRRAPAVLKGGLFV